MYTFGMLSNRGSASCECELRGGSGESGWAKDDGLFGAAARQCRIRLGSGEASRGAHCGLRVGGRRQARRGVQRRARREVLQQPAWPDKGGQRGQR